jgi:hypothetical protein
MNIDFHSKYIKYKTKYLSFKNNNNILTGGSDKKFTYLILDNQGLYHDRLREILNYNGFKEVNKQQVLSSPNKFVDFFWMGQSNEEGNRFDKDLYQIKSTLKTLLWRDNSHTRGKDVITNKQQLYLNMKKSFPEICSKHMAKTFILKDIDSLKQIKLNNADDIITTTDTDITTTDTDTDITTTDTDITTTDTEKIKKNNNNRIFIVKPVGHGACAGVGVTVVTNDKELQDIRKELCKKFNNIIISEYIQNPLLYEGRKFHLRMYILINSDATWSFWERGKAMTAKLPYKKGDWTNKLIHDSHGETTPKDIYFPEDILTKDKYRNVYEQMEIILSAVSKIIIPHIKCYEESKYCCEVFGIDFMLTDDYTVKLIEINAEAGYGAKNEDKTKYKQYCVEYFDWFYKESLLSRLFRESVMMKRNVKNKKKTSFKSGKALLKRNIIIKTYLFADKEKEIEEEFTKLLDSKGWIRKDISKFNDYVDLFYKNKYVDLFYSRNYKFFFNQLIKKQDYNKLYDIKSNIKSFFWRDDTYKKGKDVIINKYQLYKNMKKQYPEIAEKHMAKTFNILKIKDDNKNRDGIYIIRPVSKSVGSGEGIEYITNQKELLNIINKYKNNNKYSKVIASEYIEPLLLYNDKKFHIRVHILFLNNRGKITWSTNLHGRIFCARTNFINGNYDNLEIHDTHGRYSTRNIYFPEEFNYGKENTDKVLLQMELILSKVVEMIKTNLKCFPESINCFEVFGIDFMVKNDFTVILIEINDDVGNPSFPLENQINKEDKNYEENNRLWLIYVNEYVNWIYDNGIAPVYK